MKLTYGAELELADWNRELHIPANLGVVDKNDITICNSDGLAVNPYIQTGYGGEINTIVCDSPEALRTVIFRIYDILGNFSVNYSCWMHVHVGMQNIIDVTNLDELKNLLKFVHKANQWIPYTKLTPTKQLNCDVISDDAVEMLIRRNATRTSVMTIDEYEGAMNATTIDEFWKYFERKRHLINMKSLMTHGTLEFRFFYMSTDADRVLHAIEFCRDFVEHVYEGKELKLTTYPEPMKIDYDMEKSYLATIQQKRVKVDNLTGDILK